MHKSNKFAHADVIQLSIDVLFLFLTYLFSYFIVSEFTVMMDISEYLWILIIFIPIWISIMAFGGMYDKTTFYYIDRVFRNVVLATFFSGLSLGTMFFFIKETSTSRLFIAVYFMLCVAIMFLERYFCGLLYRKGNSNNITPRIIVVCSPETCISFRRYLGKTHMRYHIIGTVQIGEGEGIQDEVCLGLLRDLRDILKEQVVDEVFFYMPRDYTGDLEQYVHLCEQMGITSHLVVNHYNMQLSRTHISMLGPLPVLTFHTVNLNPFQAAVKRMMDILGALLGIFITLMVSFVIVPAIKLDSKGPVIFKQKRVGRSGRIFNLYKFRTMYIDAEAKKEELLIKNVHKDGRMFKIKEDPRITGVGAYLRKSSLDEFPQFFNVLKGDMSLVGTRPPTLDEVAQYDFENLRRISVKPGLTGMWQINGRSDIEDFEEVVALDTQYIDQWSIGLDISIMLKTVNQIVKMKSSY